MLELSQSEELLIKELVENSISQKKAKVKSIESIVKLSGDASTRMYFRVFSPGKNFVVCLDDPENLTKKDFNFLTTQEILSQNKVKVPEIYDVKKDRGYVLMQDLGDDTLLTNNSTCSSIADEEKVYKTIIDELLKIHCIDTSKYPGHSVHTTEFDFEKFHWEIEFANTNLVERYLQKKGGGISQEIAGMFKPILERVLNIKKTLVHRDFHSRNVMYSQGSYYIIDFQDARQGPLQYDLASLLEDAYFSCQRTSHFRIQEYFYKKMCDLNLIDYSFDQFIFEYDQVAIQRIYKYIGTFCYIFNERGDGRYLRYVHHGFERIKTLLYRYDEYRELRNLLCKVYYDY